MKCPICLQACENIGAYDGEMLCPVCIKNTPRVLYKMLCKAAAHIEVLEEQVKERNEFILWVDKLGITLKVITAAIVKDPLVFGKHVQLIKDVVAYEQESGPGEEDGHWAEGWAERWGGDESAPWTAADVEKATHIFPENSAPQKEGILL